MANEKTITLIEKLLCLAKDLAATKGEAELATERVHSIVAKYKIDLAIFEIYNDASERRKEQDRKEQDRKKEQQQQKRDYITEWLAKISLADAIEWAANGYDRERRLHQVANARGLSCAALSCVAPFHIIFSFSQMRPSL